ncbi:hypothetical protein OG806_46695 [Streptomyces sp. NBC_00882]|uniref:hypothetical protein n=1 Tax=Streptomyces TaxID=1883 RepID=UPI003867F4A8|nr:hypothetical protein OG806_46695 [Streptomyces sp. NBC_00882]WSZ63301.1 hypothetical protein OH824_45550 [Streptomyces canus]
MEAVLDELYTAPPSDFVARRETLAAAARTAGRMDDARRIRAARRPTLAAWAANLLLRSQPEESRQFLELGQALREAYQALDAESLKDLSTQRRRVVSALSRQAAQLARDAGHRLSQPVQQDLEATLRAVLADPDAADQWAGGRLANALTPPSEFRPGSAPVAEKPGTRSRPAAPSPSASPRRASKDELAERRRARQEQLARAREEAEAAEQCLREERARQADFDAELRRARKRTEQARRRMSAIEEQMQQAREECRQAENEQQEAEGHSRSAADVVAQAQRAVHESTQQVRRMTRGAT